MPTEHRRRHRLFWLLIALYAFQGISATPSGLVLVVDPTGGLMQMPLAMLAGSPFSNYLIPGLILCIGLGFGAFFMLVSLLALPKWEFAQRLSPFAEEHWTLAASLAFGTALMIWIAVQVLMVGLGTFLQPLYFGVGLAIFLLTLVAPMRRYLGLPAGRIAPA
jgi:hypothetical protein